MSEREPIYTILPILIKLLFEKQVKYYQKIPQLKTNLSILPTENSVNLKTVDNYPFQKPKIKVADQPEVPEVLKLSFLLNSSEHGIDYAHKY